MDSHGQQDAQDGGRHECCFVVVLVVKLAYGCDQCCVECGRAVFWFVKGAHVPNFYIEVRY